MMKRLRIWMIFLLVLLVPACSGNREKGEETTELRQQETDSREEKKGEETQQSGEGSRIKNDDMAETSLSEESSAEEISPGTTAAETTLAMTETTVYETLPALSQEEKIQHIRDMYGRIIQEQDDYRKENGKYYGEDGVLMKAEVSNGNAVLDKVMSQNGYSVYGVDYYYDDLSSGDNYPIFIYMVIDGREYRYYFYHGEFIRRVGPEGGGNTNDSPNMNQFVRALRNEGASYRYGAVQDLSDGYAEGFTAQGGTGATGSSGIGAGNKAAATLDAGNGHPSVIVTDAHKGVIESVLAQEIYFNGYQMQNGLITADQFTKSYVQNSAWHYLYYDYYNENLVAPENPCEGAEPFANPSVYYDKDKVNEIMENIYGVSSVFTSGENCYYSDDTERNWPYLEVVNNRITSRQYGGNSGDPWAWVDDMRYSLENGYLYAVGRFYAESETAMMVEGIRFIARFKINKYNRFPYQLQEINIDAN